MGKVVKGRVKVKRIIIMIWERTPNNSQKPNRLLAEIRKTLKFVLGANLKIIPLTFASRTAMVSGLIKCATGAKAQAILRRPVLIHQKVKNLNRFLNRSFLIIHSVFDKPKSL